MLLQVVGVQPQSSAIRQTNPCPPKPHPLASTAATTAGSGKKKGAKAEPLSGMLGGEGGRLPRCLEPIDVLVQIENSGACWQLQGFNFQRMYYTDNSAIQKVHLELVMHSFTANG